MQVTARVGDPRFFAATGPHRLGVIAAAAALAAPPQPDRVFHGVAPLQTAGPADVSFLDNARYADQLQHTQAGAVVLAAALLNRVPPTAIGLPSPQPYLAWARICALFFPPAPPPAGCHPSAVVDRAARIDPTAAVGPGAVVSARAEIGPGTTIGANATIGPGTVIGASCTIGAGCSLSHAVLGDRVRLLPGARIGQDGFGFAPDGAGGYVTVPQLGRVILEDDVEIGANTAIDRGSMRDTVVGAGTRIDNLVQIGHNVQIGPGCVIVSQAGISGSTTLGHHVQVAGQAGLTGHLTIGDRARIGAQAGVMDDVPGGASIVGSPAQPVREFFQHVMALRRLARRELDAGRGTEQRN